MTTLNKKKLKEVSNKAVINSRTITYEQDKKSLRRNNSLMKKGSSIPLERKYKGENVKKDEKSVGENDQILVISHAEVSQEAAREELKETLRSDRVTMGSDIVGKEMVQEVSVSKGAILALSSEVRKMPTKNDGKYVSKYSGKVAPSLPPFDDRLLVVKGGGKAKNVEKKVSKETKELTNSEESSQSANLRNSKEEFESKDEKTKETGENYRNSLPENVKVDKKKSKEAKNFLSAPKKERKNIDVEKKALSQENSGTKKSESDNSVNERKSESGKEVKQTRKKRARFLTFAKDGSKVVEVFNTGKSSLTFSANSKSRHPEKNFADLNSLEKLNSEIKSNKVVDTSASEVSSAPSIPTKKKKEREIRLKNKWEKFSAAKKSNKLKFQLEFLNCF